MTIKTKLLEKYVILSEKKPLGIDLTGIDPIGLYQESQTNDLLKQKLTRFGQIFQSLEGLKQFVSPYYMSNRNNIHSFKDAIFYNELVQIQVFFEFINRLKCENSNSINLQKIIQNRNNLKLNKIRNSIAHFDWTLENDKIIFKDDNYERKENAYEISEFCSLISLIGIFMTNNINSFDVD